MTKDNFLCIAALLLASCGCPELTTGPVQDPRVYNQTITEFNAGWNPPVDPNDLTDLGSPVPRFSIGTFEFPTGAWSSGNFPNDERFADGRRLVFDSETFSGGGGMSFIAQLISRSPSNNTMVGDIMVVGVDPTATPRTARLRFFGRLFRFPDPLTSGSATDFVEYIRANAHTTAQLEALRDMASVHGAAYTAPQSQSLDAIVVDSLGREIAGTPIPAVVQGLLGTNEVIADYDVTVEIGQVYYYIARNGVEFAIHIEDIFEGTLAPNQRRVTIKFAALHGPELCQPQSG